MSIASRPIDPGLFIDALKSRLLVDRDIDLASALGLGKSTIASWRRRGMVPDNILQRASNEFGLTKDRLHELSVQNQHEIAKFASIGFYYAILRLGSTLDFSKAGVGDDGSLLELAANISAKDHEILKNIAQAVDRLPDGASSGGLSLWFAVESGKIGSPDELRLWIAQSTERGSTS